MNWFLYLPNLTSITSDHDGFKQPRSVTLSSIILKNWVLNRYSESENGWSYSLFILACWI